MPHKDKGPKLI